MTSDDRFAAATEITLGPDLATALRTAATGAPAEGVLVRVRNAAFVDARLTLLHGDLPAGGIGAATRRSLFAAAAKAELVITELQRIERRSGAAADLPLAAAVRDLVQLDPNAGTEWFVVRVEQPSAANRPAADALDRSLSADEDAAAAQVRTLVEAQLREQAELLAGRQELIAVQNGKLMRWSQFPRRVYRRLRRLLRLG